MSYTIIWFAKHRPDAASKTLHISHAGLWGALATMFVVVPVVFFLWGAGQASPEAVRSRLEAQTLEVAELTAKHRKTDDQFKQLQRRYQELQAEYLAETGRRAEIEARLEITENARANALQSLDEAEKKRLELSDKLAVFKDIFKPTEDAIPVQCYNIEVTETREGINYQLALMKTDIKDTKNLDVDLQMRVLTGSNVVTLGEAALDKADRMRSTSLTRQVALSGIIRGQFPKKGMRVLDVRGYDKSGKKLLTHCWKVF